MIKRNMTIRKCIYTDTFIKVPLGKDAKHGYALIDHEDIRITKYNWTVKKTGNSIYAVRRSDDNSRIEKMQWYILPTKTGHIIDHINGNGLDNRRNNLRHATRQQNQWNHAINKANTTGYKGVSFRKNTNKFGARMRIDGKYKSLGCYSTAIEAAKVYREKELELRKEFART